CRAAARPLSRPTRACCAYLHPHHHRKLMAWLTRQAKPCRFRVRAIFTPGKSLVLRLGISAFKTGRVPDAYKNPPWDNEIDIQFQLRGSWANCQSLIPKERRC